MDTAVLEDIDRKEREIVMLQQYADDIYRLNRRYDVMPTEVPKNTQKLLAFLRGRRLAWAKNLEEVVPDALYQDGKTGEAYTIHQLRNEAQSLIDELRNQKALYECFLKVERPYIVEANRTPYYKLNDKYGYITDDIVHKIRDEHQDKYDGVIFKNIVDTMVGGMLPGSEVSDVVVVFDEAQIKSTANYATTTDKRAAYDSVIRTRAYVDGNEQTRLVLIDDALEKVRKATRQQMNAYLRKQGVSSQAKK